MERLQLLRDKRRRKEFLDTSDKKISKGSQIIEGSVNKDINDVAEVDETV